MRNLVTVVLMLIAAATTGCEATRSGAGAPGGATAPTLTLPGRGITFASRNKKKRWLRVPSP